MEIYLQKSEERVGPYSADEVCAMVSSGQTMRSDLAWREGMLDWLPLEQVVSLPARPAPPPLPKGPPRPLAGLPPVPARMRAQPGPSVGAAETARPPSTIRTVSGVIALILGLLAIFNIGGCMNAQGKLTKFQRGDDPLDGVNMFVDTFRGANEGDPLRGVAGLTDKARSLQDDCEGFQVGAWLCLVGTVVAGGVCRFAGPPRSV